MSMNRELGEEEADLRCIYCILSDLLSLQETPPPINLPWFNASENDISYSSLYFAVNSEAPFI